VYPLQVFEKPLASSTGCRHQDPAGSFKGDSLTLLQLQGYPPRGRDEGNLSVSTGIYRHTEDLAITPFQVDRGTEARL